MIIALSPLILTELLNCTKEQLFTNSNWLKLNKKPIVSSIQPSACYKQIIDSSWKRSDLLDLKKYETIDRSCITGDYIPNNCSRKATGKKQRI